MGEFSDAVYDIVAHIPRSTVASYGQIARLMGRPQSGRYVGFALRNNPRPGSGPDAVPCHRVVYGDGRLCAAFVFGGPDVQFELLRAEGVRFVELAASADDGAVDEPCIVVDLDDGRGKRSVPLSRVRVDMATCQWSGHDAPDANGAGRTSIEGRSPYPTQPPADFDWNTELGE